jgi:hypothetical protein
VILLLWLARIQWEWNGVRASGSKTKLCCKGDDDWWWAMLSYAPADRLPSIDHYVWWALVKYRWNARRTWEVHIINLRTCRKERGSSLSVTWEMLPIPLHRWKVYCILLIYVTQYLVFSRYTLDQVAVLTSYSLPSINVNPREWIKVNIYRGGNN